MNRLPDIKLELGGHPYTFSRNTYFEQTSNENCILMIKPSKHLQILGDSFMRGYHVIFDAGNYKIQLYEKSPPQGNSWARLVIMSLLILMAIVCLGLCLSWLCKT
mmetsp:Transcript_16610/g.36513  ORF Transcript_16610/g.36513 Transcript_16610/m.36513 type:complete len:105 (+) Transcript_16610:482-796(+)